MTYIDQTLLDPAGAPLWPGYTPPGAEEPATHDPNAWWDRLDGDMRKVLETFETLQPLPIETLTAEAARQQPTVADAALTLLRARTLDRFADLGVKTQDITLQGAAGPLAARLYGVDPEREPDAKLKPVVVYWHGGGFVLADLNTYDSSPRAIARFADCIVVSCDYRHAPEDKFPAAHDDAFAAYLWVLAHAESFGGDPAKVAVMGESAGGNLAANVAIRARDEGAPAPVYQALIYPVAGHDMETPSYLENARAKPLNRAMMGWFVDKYLERPAQAYDPRINLLAANLEGLPDATVVCAEIDPLRSEGEALAEKLRSAGAEVRAHTFKGVTHEFFGMGLVVKDAAAAEQMVAHNLKRGFGTAIFPI
jgi:acetyl esterase/lipase